LEKASDDVMEGTREKMDLYARKLHQPTVYLYYFGILLPLLLAIILPIGGSMSGQSLATPLILFVAYNLVIPAGVYVFGKSILSGRPPTYTPPKIGADFPGLRIKPAFLTALLVFTALAGFGYLTDQGTTQGWLNAVLAPASQTLYDATNGDLQLVDPTTGFQLTGTLGQIPAYASDREEEIKKIPHLAFFYDGYGVFIGFFTVFGLLFGLSLATSIWLKAKYGGRKKIQDEIRGMETEFKDALYILASRLGENKPVEEAIRSSIDFLPKSALAQNVFKRVLENISTMGMTLDGAIFDETFGALANLPSRTLASGMRFLVDSVTLGVNVASRSLISLALQMRNAQKIDDSLRKLLEDVTTMLKTMATFVAPVVLAVVSAMQRMIINSMSSNAASDTQQMQGVSGFSMPTAFSSPEAAKASADPATFTLIMGVYVIQVVALLCYFNSEIDDPHNGLAARLAIAQALPLATLLFFVTAYVTGSFLATGG